MNGKTLFIGMVLGVATYSYSMEFIDTKEKFYGKVYEVQVRDIEHLKALSLGMPLIAVSKLLACCTSSGAGAFVVSSACIFAVAAQWELIAPHYGSLSWAEERAFKQVCDECFHGPRRHRIDSSAFQSFIRDKHSCLKWNTRLQYKHTLSQKKRVSTGILFANWKHNLCLKQNDDTFDPGCQKVYKELERFYNLCAIGVISFIPKDPSENVYDARCVRPFKLPKIPNRPDPNRLNHLANTHIPKLYGTKCGLPVKFCLKGISREDRRIFENLFYDRQLEMKLAQPEKRE